MLFRSVASIAPVLTQHCALRPGGPHAAKKQAHWQAVAVAACEQSGRNRLPAVRPIRPLDEALADDAAAANSARLVLSLRPDAAPLRVICAELPAAQAVTLLSGPEGGLSAAEEAQALADGFALVSLGTRVLRAETAPLAALALLLA